MTDIHDILWLINPPNYFYLTYSFLSLLTIFILYLISIYYKSSKIKNNKYDKNIFLKDIEKIKKESINNYSQELWKKLHRIFNKYFWENIKDNIHSLSYKEISKNKNLEHIKKIIEIFEKHFFHYEKKTKNDLIELINQIESKI